MSAWPWDDGSGPARSTCTWKNVSWARRTRSVGLRYADKLLLLGLETSARTLTHVALNAESHKISCHQLHRSGYNRIRKVSQLKKCRITMSFIYHRPRKTLRHITKRYILWFTIGKAAKLNGMFYRSWSILEPVTWTCATASSMVPNFGDKRWCRMLESASATGLFATETSYVHGKLWNQRGAFCVAGAGRRMNAARIPPVCGLLTTEWTTF